MVWEGSRQRAAIGSVGHGSGLSRFPLSVTQEGCARMTQLKGRGRRVRSTHGCEQNLEGPLSESIVLGCLHQQR